MKVIIRSIIIAVALLSAGSLYSQSLIKTVVSLTGNVFNQVNKQPETAALIVYKDGEKVTATRSRASNNGSYYLTGLKAGTTYEIQLHKPGFMDQKYTIEVPNTDKYTEISKDFLLMPKESGTKIPLSVPPFEYNKSKLRYGSDIFLDDLKETLELNPEVNIEVVCYPDNDKNSQENIELTKKRAESLKEYFVNNGISADRITIQGNKTTDPENPPPKEKEAKGKRYIGQTYLKITSL